MSIKFKILEENVKNRAYEKKEWKTLFKLNTDRTTTRQMIKKKTKDFFLGTKLKARRYDDNDDDDDNNYDDGDEWHL